MIDRGARRDMLRDAAEVFGAEALRHTGAVGMVVAVADSEGPLFECGLGLLDEERELPMSADAVFPLGSIGKPLTTTAVMRAVESGAVTLDTPVEDYLGYAVRHPRRPAEPVTLRRLLTHTSGLHVDAHGVRTDGVHMTTRDYLRGLVERGVSHEYGGVPLWGHEGSGYQYSSIGFQLAAEAVGCALGRPIGEVIRQEICHPLGMHSTYTGPLEHVPADLDAARATGHMLFGELAIPTPDFPSRLPESTGVLSTAGDLARWGTMVLRGGAAPDGTAILSAESLRVMSEPLFPAAFPGEVPLRVAIGMQVYEGSFGHIGTYPFGWSGQLRIYPELNLVIAALINSSDMLRYVPPSDRSAWGLLADHLARVAAGGAGILPANDADKAELYGALVAERFSLIGVARAGAYLARRMAERARRRTGIDQLSEHEMERFVRGVVRGIQAGPTAEGIARMLQGPDAPTDPDTAGLVALALGASRARWPSPHPEWTRQQREA